MSKRCCFCNIRVNLLGFECKFCNNNLCTKHRLPEDHDCKSMDLLKNQCKEMNRRKLESESVKDNKVIHI